MLAAVVLFSEVILGWRLRIRTDSVEGPDSGGFRAALQGDFLAHFAFCMGIFTIENRIPDFDGFGRGSDSDGFLDPKHGSSHQPSREVM